MYSEFEPYKTIELQKLKIGLELYVAKGFGDEADHHIAYKIRGYVWSQDAGKKVTFKYPSDWWEAFKERWFSAWLLEKYPVKYTHKEFQVKATYPDLVVQNHQPVMRLIESTWTDGFYDYLTKHK